MGEPVDGRTDTYAVGCVAYYLLTAQLVFDADNAMQWRSSARLLASIAEAS